MAEPAAVAKLTEQVKAQANDRRVQVTVGIAILAFAGGLYLGVKLRGPQDWVPPVDRAPIPCPECEEKGQAQVNGVARTLSPDELRELAEMLKPQTVPDGSGD